jgi:spore germination protein GerM/predicted small lipoprotein YifL
MKKYILTVCLMMSFLLLTGCGRKKNTNPLVSPTPQPTAPIESEQPSPTIAETEDGTNADRKDTWTIADFYPALEDMEYVYKGVGMEYASFTVFMDYFDKDTNRYQTRTDNGGTVTAKVMEIKDGKLSVIKSVGEAYYRDNLLDTEAEKDVEVLLMEPLVRGTRWTLPDGSERYISNINVKVETDLGTYDAIEVKTEGTDSTTKDYYSPGVGLIKSIFRSEEYEVSSTLSEIKTNTPYKLAVDFYYPEQDEKIHVVQKEITFHTNDVTRLVLEKAVKEKVLNNNYVPLISTNTKINSMYLGKDHIVYVDFSKELIEEMEAGSGFEQLILQSITNTLGSYYGVKEVCITVDQKPYESGHILLKEGETLKVNMDLVVR